MKITRNEIEQVTEHVPEQVVDLMGHEGSKGLAITWRFFGESGDYLAISEVIAMLLGRNWVTNGSNRLKIIPQKSRDIFVTFMGHIGQISDIYWTYNKNAKSVSKGNIMNFKYKKPQINADERRLISSVHRKGCKESKAMKQESLRPLRSLRLNVFFAPAPERAPPAPPVHLRLSRAGGMN
ncbi:MAG: hypothetical protein KKI06_13045 [Euryarchaeota archaeon]|nr:hypothetical protein [Euryarchaeota archaeon]MBU4221456.1 hypothetical protein [Euryarchaeota archaeon]MBU4539587.1 hypothetical protein [Bacteroidota bacterium]MCG2736126.1 hypothetical protein [Candidatus Methanoperedenaceae archaeon]